MREGAFGFVSWKMGIFDFFLLIFFWLIFFDFLFGGGFFGIFFLEFLGVVKEKGGGVCEGI